MQRISTYLMLYILLAALLTLTAGCSVVSSRQYTPAAATPEVTPVQRFTVSTWEDIPLYPGALLFDPYLSPDEPGRGTFLLTTADPVRQVIDDYTKILVEDGWVRTALFEDELRPVLHLTWRNPGSVPARRYLRLSVHELATGETEVSAHFDRWPDASKIPFYPESQDEQVTWESDVQHTRPVQMTSYIAMASAEEIETYYKDAMIQHGWGLGIATGSAAIAFNFVVPSPDNLFGQSWSYVAIQLGPGPNAGTKVTLRAIGSEVKP